MLAKTQLISTNTTILQATKHPTSMSSNFDKSSFDAPSGDSWWEKMLSRRKLIRNVAIGAGVVGLAVMCSDNGEDEIDAEKDALDLQKKEGWNVGSDERPLRLADKAGSDSRGTQDWKKFTEPQQMLGVFQPTNPALKPFFVPTLIQSLAQPTLRSAVQPVLSDGMKAAYARGVAMKQLLGESKDANKTALVVDVAGAEAVAFAAALSDVLQPVLTFDNWPHPLGVVSSQQTLGAMLFFAQEFAENNSKRPANAPALYVLDANRLAKYTDAENQFDNRYVAKLPTVENFQTLQTASVLYAVAEESQQSELDDLNDEFATYKDKGLNVSLMALSRFQPSSDQALQASAAQPSATQTTTNTLQASKQAASANSAYPANSSSYGAYVPTYYYGGSPGLSPWFFYHYAAYSYYRPMPPMTRLPATSFTRSAYQPTRRPTVFSANVVGGRTGVGRQRPAGFGMVGVRVGATSGAVSAVRAGRSGSFGSSRSFRVGSRSSGSRSGSFGRSFGGRSS
jgi:hypothetical protein